MFVFHKLLKETREVDAGSSIIILQKYLDNKNSTERVNGKTVDRYMTSNEFLPNEPYGCKIIMTNTSAREKTVTLFYQIPQGAFPLTDYQPVRSKTLLLKPYSTTLFSYSFYFTAWASSRTTPRTSSTPWTSRWLPAPRCPSPR